MSQAIQSERDQHRSARAGALDRSETDAATRRPPRIALVTLKYPPLYSGAALQAIQVIRGLLGRGARVTVLTAYRGRPPRELESIPPSAHVVRFFTPPGVLPRHLTLGARAAFWLLRHRDWDVLHLIDFHFCSLFPALVARLLRRPILTKTTLLDQNAPVISLGGRLLCGVRDWGYRSSGAVVALSDALEVELRKVGVDEGRIVRLPNGVDTELFRPGTPAERSASRRAYGLPERTLVVVSFGMLSSRKNPMLLVRAALRMRERPVHLVLAGPFGGDPPYEAELRRLVGQCPPDVRVHLPGGLAHEQVAQLLQAADVFALTSLSEGMPNSLLEGMATGLPSVATDIPGSRDLLEQGGGRLLPPDDPEALAAQLDEYARDPALRARDGARAREIIEAHYGIAAVTEQYLRTYDALQDGRLPAATV